MIALVLSSAIIVLVSTTFLVQSRYYSGQTLRAGAHDNARAATDRMASEIRSVMRGGFVTAGNKSMTIRSPMVLMMVCDLQGQNAHVHNEGGETGLDTDEVAGVAWLNKSTGVWDYRTTTWSYIDGTGGTPASRCASNGADTAWAASDFHRIRRLNLIYGTLPSEGDLLMLYRETTYTIQTSVLEPTTLGLFRGIYGQSLVEFATGFDTSAQFRYRTGGATYANSVAAGQLVNIDAVQLVADARRRATSAGMNDVTFGWSTNILLRNIP